MFLASILRAPDPLQIPAALTLLVIFVRALLAWISPRILRQSRSHAMGMGLIALGIVWHRLEVGRFSLLTWGELWSYTIADGQFLASLEALTRALRCYILPLIVLVLGVCIGSRRDHSSAVPKDAVPKDAVPKEAVLAKSASRGRPRRRPSGRPAKGLSP